VRVIPEISSEDKCIKKLQLDKKDLENVSYFFESLFYTKTYDLLTQINLGISKVWQNHKY